MNWQTTAQLFLLPKEGGPPEECEDAVGANSRAGNFAVADGATEAFDAGRWARRLVAMWVEAEPSPIYIADFRTWAAAQGEWLHALWENRPLSWYAEEKRRAGSFAAFVGLHFREAGPGLCWRAIAVGDSCLVQRRGQEVTAALPIADAQGFNSCPVLVPSRAAALDATLARAVEGAGEAKDGDVFLLLSDAVAAWFLGLCERRHPLVAEVDSLLAASENEAVAELLRRERAAQRLKDDDVAIIRIAVKGK